MTGLSPRRLLPLLVQPAVWAALTTTVVVVLTWQVSGGLGLSGREVSLVVGRGLSRIGVVVVVGLLLALVLLPGEEHGRAVRPWTTAVLATSALVGAWLWLAGAVWELAVRYLITTVGGTADDPASIGAYVLGDWHGALYLSQLLLVLLLLALLSGRSFPSRLAAVRGLLVAGLAAGTLPLTGHTALLPPGPRLTVVLHVLSSIAWVGGLAGLLAGVWVVARLGDEPEASHRVLVAGMRRKAATPVTTPTLTPAGRRLLTAVRSYSSIALGASLTTTVTGLQMALGKAGQWIPSWDAWTALVLGKLVLTGLALSAGALHRLVTVRELEAGRPLPFVRLAAVELSVLAVVLVLAVALPHAG